MWNECQTKWQLKIAFQPNFALTFFFVFIRCRYTTKLKCWFLFHFTQNFRNWITWSEMILISASNHIDSSVLHRFDIFFILFLFFIVLWMFLIWMRAFIKYSWQCTKMILVSTLHFIFSVLSLNHCAIKSWVNWVVWFWFVTCQCLFASTGFNC